MKIQLFDSQTKDYMNTPVSKFGSKCEVSDKFIEKIAKLGVMDAACALTEIKETKAAKKTMEINPNPSAEFLNSLMPTGLELLNRVIARLFVVKVIQQRLVFYQDCHQMTVM